MSAFTEHEKPLGMVESARVGDYARLLDNTGERFWVRIAGVGPRGFTGTVRNTLLHRQAYAAAGSVVTFGVRNVTELRLSGPHMAFRCLSEVSADARRRQDLGAPYPRDELRQKIEDILDSYNPSFDSADRKSVLENLTSEGCSHAPSVMMLFVPMHLDLSARWHATKPSMTRQAFQDEALAPLSM